MGKNKIVDIEKQKESLIDLLKNLEHVSYDEEHNRFIVDNAKVTTEANLEIIQNRYKEFLCNYKGSKMHRYKTSKNKVLVFLRIISKDINVRFERFTIGANIAKTSFYM
jgi:hypothetical protein